jgi:hypothetical protein
MRRRVRTRRSTTPASSIGTFVRRSAADCEKDHAMRLLVTALLSFGAFLLIGLMLKVAIGIWMKRQ